MKIEDIEPFEQLLASKGYRKIYQSKAKSQDTYEWYKAFRDSDYELKYQIFFEFWDFTKYGENYWGLSICIMPESCKNDVGRRDLELSVDWATNLEKVEKTAEKYYDFITEIDKM